MATPRIVMSLSTFDSSSNYDSRIKGNATGLLELEWPRIVQLALGSGSASHKEQALQSPHALLGPAEPGARIIQCRKMYWMICLRVSVWPLFCKTCITKPRAARITYEDLTHATRVLNSGSPLTDHIPSLEPHAIIDTLTLVACRPHQDTMPWVCSVSSRQSPRHP